MVSNQKLFSVGSFDFRAQHLLVLGILVLTFSLSVIIRAGPLNFDTQLFEYDPFFNFRATEYLIENGYENYFTWHDEKAWYPFGRDVSDTSQVTLHFAAAFLYQVFGFGMPLYTFLIYMPLVISAITAIVVFGLVRVLAGTTAGLISSLMFAITIPLVIRGFAGWFKSEPLGVFLGVLALYFFVSGIKSDNNKISILKLIAGAFCVTLSISAWGGSIFFLVVILVFYFALPFLKNQKKYLIYGIPIFSGTVAAFSLMFERTTDFIIGYVGTPTEAYFLIGYIGYFIIFATIFFVISEIIKKFSNETKRIRNCLIFLGGLIVSGIGVLSTGFIGVPSFRYLNALNPLLDSEDPLVASVQEHVPSSLNHSFGFFSIFLVFGLLGIWFLFSKQSKFMRKDMIVFTLIVSLIAIYLSSAFLRLELFAGLGLILLGATGLSIILKEVYTIKKSGPKIILSAGILILFIIPISLPVEASWSHWSGYSPTISSGGQGYDKTFVSNDWLVTMEWLKNNTPEDAVIAAWWDYGYWITTLSERSTLADNATLLDWQIKKMAYILLTDPDSAWTMLHYENDVDITSVVDPEFMEYLSIDSAGNAITPIELDPNCKNVFAAEHNLTGKPLKFCNPTVGGMGADYILVYATAEKIYSEGVDVALYQMLSGGDESKKYWFAEISNQDDTMYTLPDGQTPTKYFLEETLLGQLLPFEIVAYYDQRTGMITNIYSDDSIAIFTLSLMFNDPENDPFSLVYASPSFYSTMPGPKNMILIYEINTDYEPIQEIP